MKMEIISIKKSVESPYTTELIEAIGELCEKHEAELIKTEFDGNYIIVTEVDE